MSILREKLYQPLNYMKNSHQERIDYSNQDTQIKENIQNYYNKNEIGNQISPNNKTRQMKMSDQFEEQIYQNIYNDLTNQKKKIFDQLNEENLDLTYQKSQINNKQLGFNNDHLNSEYYKYLRKEDEQINQQKKKLSISGLNHYETQRDSQKKMDPFIKLESQEENLQLLNIKQPNFLQLTQNQVQNDQQLLYQKFQNQKKNNFRISRFEDSPKQFESKNHKQAQNDVKKPKSPVTQKVQISMQDKFEKNMQIKRAQQKQQQNTRGNDFSVSPIKPKHGTQKSQLRNSDEPLKTQKQQLQTQISNQQAKQQAYLPILDNEIYKQINQKNIEKNPVQRQSYTDISNQDFETRYNLKSSQVSINGSISVSQNKISNVNVQKTNFQKDSNNQLHISPQKKSKNPDLSLDLENVDIFAISSQKNNFYESNQDSKLLYQIIENSSQRQLKQSYINISQQEMQQDSSQLQINSLLNAQQKNEILQKQLKLPASSNLHQNQYLNKNQIKKEIKNSQDAQLESQLVNDMQKLKKQDAELFSSQKQHDSAYYQELIITQQKNYSALLNKKNQEIQNLKTIITEQQKDIHEMINNFDRIQKDNEQLRNSIQNRNLELDSHKKRYMLERNKKDLQSINKRTIEDSCKEEANSNNVQLISILQQQKQELDEKLNHQQELNKTLNLEILKLKNLIDNQIPINKQNESQYQKQLVQNEDLLLKQKLKLEKSKQKKSLLKEQLKQLKQQNQKIYDDNQKNVNSLIQEQIQFKDSFNQKNNSYLKLQEEFQNYKLTVKDSSLQNDQSYKKLKDEINSLTQNLKSIKQKYEELETKILNIKILAPSGLDATSHLICLASFIENLQKNFSDLTQQIEEFQLTDQIGQKKNQSQEEIHEFYQKQIEEVIQSQKMIVSKIQKDTEKIINQEVQKYKTKYDKSKAIIQKYKEKISRQQLKQQVQIEEYHSPVFKFAHNTSLTLSDISNN